MVQTLGREWLPKGCVWDFKDSVPKTIYSLFTAISGEQGDWLETIDLFYYPWNTGKIFVIQLSVNFIFTVYYWQHEKRLQARRAILSRRNVLGEDLSQVSDSLCSLVKQKPRVPASFTQGNTNRIHSCQSKYWDEYFTPVPDNEMTQQFPDMQFFPYVQSRI
jgi:hypothetical protein